jgi:hypothetical protein
VSWHPAPSLADADIDTQGGPLPGGVFHLLIADGDLAARVLRSRVTVCGAVVHPRSLPPSWFRDGDEIDGDPRYCLECVREAVRWSAEGLNEGGPVLEIRS